MTTSSNDPSTPPTTPPTTPPAAAPTPAPTPKPNPNRTWGEEDDATFFVSLAVGVLGVLATLGGIAMYIGASAADAGSDMDIFAKRNWILGGGAGLIVLAIGLSWDRVMKLVGQRRSVTALNVLAMSLLAAFLTGIVNYMSYRHFHEFDCTRQGVYSISDETVQLITHLEKPIRIFVLPDQSQEDHDKVLRLIDHYKAKAPDIAVEQLDPANKMDWDIKMKTLNLEDRQYADLLGAIIVQSGTLDPDGHWKVEKSKHITAHELFESAGFDPRTHQEGQKTFKGEQVLTNAILDVIEEAKPKLCFLTGHGEETLEDVAPQNIEGTGQLTKILRQKNYDVEALDLVKRDRHDIPEDATVLVLNGPTRKLDDFEITAIEGFLKNGGKVFALMPPIIAEDSATNEIVWRETGLEPLLRKYNVGLENKHIVGYLPVGGYVTETTDCIADVFEASSKIAAPFAGSGSRILMVDARPVKALSTAPGVSAKEIVKSSKGYFTTPDADYRKFFEKEPGKDDKQDSWPILVTAEQKLDTPAAKPDDKSKPKERWTRLVVAGDSRWTSNPIIDKGSARNEALFLNCLSYLLGQERFSKDAVREMSYKLDVTPGLVQLYRFAALFGMPLIAILLGLSVWIIRGR